MGDPLYSLYCKLGNAATVEIDEDELASAESTVKAILDNPDSEYDLYTEEEIQGLLDRLT
jgi:hypothetical protein